jgi:hypothetical protein
MRPKLPAEICPINIRCFVAPNAAATVDRSSIDRLRGAFLLATTFCLLLSAFSLPASAKAQASAGPATQASPSATGPRGDAKSQELVNQVIQALGGQAFLNFKTLSSRGRFFSIYEGETMGFAPYESEVEPPDKRKFAYGKSQPVILLNNGDRGWEQDRYGLIRQKMENIKRWQVGVRYSLEGLLRRVVREPGTLIQDGGMDFVDLLPARVLEITDARQVDVKVYLSRSNYLPIRIAYRIRDPESGDWNEYADAFSEYRAIQGIQTPMHITRYENGQRALEYFLTAVEYNKEFPADYFQPRR